MDIFLLYASFGVIVAFMSFNLWSLLREQRVITDGSWKIFACDECFSSWISIIVIGTAYVVIGFVEIGISLATALIAIKILSKQYWS